MEVLLKIKNATPGNIKIKLNKALKRLGTDFHIEKCIKIRKSEKGRKLQGRINFQGLNISIENRKGSIRYGIDSDGHSWKTKMNYPYGRIIGVQRLGHDGDHIDCYVGDNRQSDKVYIIHIKNCVTGKYDEDKIMLGFNNQKEVITAFKTQYDNFSKIFDGIEKMSIYEFKECLKKKTKSIIVKLKDFTHENADYKVIKALAGVGKALNCDFICKSIDIAKAKNPKLSEAMIGNQNARKNKVKHDGEYVLTKNGSKDFGEITKEIGRQPGKIRLRIGIHDENSDKGEGEAHIERPKRLKQLKMHGFDNARDFVEYTCNNYDEVYSSGMALLLVKKDNGFTCVVQLTPLKNDEFYDVKTVYVMPERTIKNKLAKDKIRLIWQKPNSPLSKSLSPYCLKSDNGIPTGFIKGTPDRSSIPKPINKSINHAEKPSYQALQDIIDNSNAEVEKIKRQAYNFLCKFLGLPKINKISKSITDELTVNGKIIFDPLYGKPLKQKDFAQMINKLENFLSRRLAETERQMLLQSTALGHLIALSKNGQTQLLLETVKLKNIVHKGKSFEQLCTDYETLKHNFDKVTDNEIAKLQFIEDKIGVYVTSAKDATIKIIKDIYYDAIINHKSKQKISQEMYDQLGFLNRSWDTIVRTESNNLKNHAFIVGSLNDKGKTYFRRRVGSYNTCKICASHRDKIALWSEKPLTDDTINDELADIAIWSGKSNIGRNQKDWWIPEGSTHPNCFCEWEKLLDEEVKYFRKSFTESDHPRAENGRFITKFAPDKGGVCGGSSHLNKKFNGDSVPENERKEKLRNQKAIKIDKSDYEGKTDKECREIAKDKYKNLKPIFKDKIKIEFPMSGFKETKHHSADKNVLYIIEQLPELLESAVFMYREPNTDPKKENTLNMFNYAVKTNIDGTDYFTRIVIREDKGGNYYYDNDSINLKKAGMKFLSEPNPGAHQNQPYMDRISQWLSGVKLDVNNKHDISNIKKCRTILYKKNPNGNVGYTHHNDMSRNSSISKPINKSINHAEKPSYQALQDIIDNSNR